MKSELAVRPDLIPPGLDPVPGKFSHREGEQFDDPDPAGERLGYPLHHQEVLGSGKDEVSRPLVPVEDSLGVRKEFRDSLHLIENCPGLFVLCKKTAWILLGKGPGSRALPEDWVRSPAACQMLNSRRSRLIRPTIDGVD